MKKHFCKLLFLIFIPYSTNSAAVPWSDADQAINTSKCRRSVDGQYLFENYSGRLAGPENGRIDYVLTKLTDDKLELLVVKSGFRLLLKAIGEKDGYSLIKRNGQEFMFCN